MTGQRASEGDGLAATPAVRSLVLASNVGSSEHVTRDWEYTGTANIDTGISLGFSLSGSDAGSGTSDTSDIANL